MINTITNGRGLVRLTPEQKQPMLEERLLRQELLLEESRLTLKAAEAAYEAVRREVEGE
jgi:hypothetical protein